MRKIVFHSIIIHHSILCSSVIMMVYIGLKTFWIMFGKDEIFTCKAKQQSHQFLLIKSKTTPFNKFHLRTDGWENCYSQTWQKKFFCEIILNHSILCFLVTRMVYVGLKALRMMCGKDEVAVRVKQSSSLFAFTHSSLPRPRRWRWQICHFYQLWSALDFIHIENFAPSF